MWGEVVRLRYLFKRAAQKSSFYTASSFCSARQGTPTLSSSRCRTLCGSNLAFIPTFISYMWELGICCTVSMCQWKLQILWLPFSLFRREKLQASWQALPQAKGPFVMKRRLLPKNSSEEERMIFTIQHWSAVVWTISPADLSFPRARNSSEPRKPPPFSPVEVLLLLRDSWRSVNAINRSRPLNLPKNIGYCGGIKSFQWFCQCCGGSQSSQRSVGSR